jgi:hypothetical protein
VGATVDSVLSSYQVRGNFDEEQRNYGLYSCCQKKSDNLQPKGKCVDCQIRKFCNIRIHLNITMFQKMHVQKPVTKQSFHISIPQKFVTVGKPSRLV